MTKRRQEEYRQDPPFAVQIELSEGCNLYCDFCGLQGIRTKEEKNFRFMDVSTAAAIALELELAAKHSGWNPRIEFAMHGEPTMNPDFIMIVKRFRKKLPKTQLMMTSNGGGLLRPPGVCDNLKNLFDAGLNVFAFDAYEYVKIKDKVDAALWDDGSKGLVELDFDVHRYPDEKEFSPHNRYGHTARKFIRVQDISQAEKGTHSSLNNHCGSGSPPLKEPLEARCAKPFRELSIRWDGSVAICCNDWRGVYKCGNVVEDGLEAVWHSDEFNAARRFLIRGERGMLSPCDVCDAKSYRVGLLPDKKGKVKLPKPDYADEKIVNRAASKTTLTEVVVRPWEIKTRKR